MVKLHELDKQELLDNLTEKQFEAAVDDKHKLWYFTIESTFDQPLNNILIKMHDAKNNESSKEMFAEFKEVTGISVVEASFVTVITLNFNFKSTSNPLLSKTKWVNYLNENEQSFIISNDKFEIFKAQYSVYLKSKFEVFDNN